MIIVVMAGSLSDVRVDFVIAGLQPVPRKLQAELGAFEVDVGAPFAPAEETLPGRAVFLDRFEFRVGYKALWVGDIEIHGPMTGIAIWF